MTSPGARAGDRTGPRPGAERGESGRRRALIWSVGTSTGLVLVGYLPVNAFGILVAPMADGSVASFAGLSLGPSALFGTAAVMSVVMPRLFRQTSLPRLVIGSILASVAGWLLVAVASNLWLLIAGLAACGAALASCLPAVNWIARAHLPETFRSTGVGISQTGSQCAALASGALFPVLVEGPGWRIAALVAAAMTAVVLVGAMHIGPDGRDRDTPAPRSHAQSLPTSVRRGWALCIYPFVMGAAVTPFFVCLPIYLVEVGGMTLRQAGAVVLGNALIGLLAKLAWGRVSDRTARGMADLVVVSGVTGLGLAGIGLAGGRSVWLIIAACVVVSLFGVPWATVQMVTLLRLRSMRAAEVLGWRTVAAGFLGMGAGPLLYAVATARSGFTAAWLLVGGLAFMGVPAARLYAWATDEDRRGCAR